MIYFPNKFEKMTASLRSLYQKLIIKNGLKPTYIKSLQKIIEAEAMYKPTEPEPINLKLFLNEILTAVFLRKIILNRNFDYYFKIENSFLIDIKIFTNLLLQICSETEYIEIFEKRKMLIIKAFVPKTQKINLLTKKLNGYVLRELKENTLYLIFNFQITDKKARDFEDANRLLQNPLSYVNLYIN